MLEKVSKYNSYRVLQKRKNKKRRKRIMLKKTIKTLAISLSAAALITAIPFTATAKPKELSKSVKVGDIVYFGKYEQDGNTKNGKEKIEWQVLEKKGNKALLISKKVLDVQPDNKEFKDITWEKCTLRKWINKDFIKEAFNAKESKKIQNSKIKNTKPKAEKILRIKFSY